MVRYSECIDTPPWLPEHRIGGHPALDLVNTISDRLDPTMAVDRMNNAEKIASWCVFEGLLSQVQANGLFNEVLAEGSEANLVQSVAALRDAAGQALDAVALGNPPDAAVLARILTLSAEPRVVLSKVSRDHKAASEITFQELNPQTVIAALALLVVDAIFRLPAERIRACPRCGWLFHDASKAGRRRWCDMKVCGNREKASRNYHARLPRP